MNKLNTMHLDNTIKKITEIVMKACSHLQKNFDLDIPDDPKKLWERSYNDIEKNGRIFALYSCGMFSIYLYHCLKEDFPNLSIGLLTGEKANEKKKNAPKEEKLHFFVKVKDQGKNYIIDNRTKMVIDIFQGDEPKRDGEQHEDLYGEKIQYQWFDSIKKDSTVITLVPDLCEKQIFKRKIKHGLKYLKDTIQPETREQYQQRKIYLSGNEEPIVVTPNDRRKTST